ncbi:MAG TPA: sugar transferase [Thermoanaerobaculia bacterium]|nr:sugar transferase [Thermoanaerobaculia bacterium]
MSNRSEEPGSRLEGSRRLPLVPQTLHSNAPVRSGIARPAEAVLALAGLAVSAPLVILAGALVLLTSGRPALFRQERVGRGGRLFRIYKLRTMHPAAGTVELTGKDDVRVTRLGKFLRKTKIDELPQLWNVVKGDMSLVGPRPEVARYVDRGNPLWDEVLRVRPGITDPVAIQLRDEEALLAQAAGDRERFYLEQLQPLKLEGYVAYIRRRSWRTDVSVLGKTFVALLGPAGASRAEVRISSLQDHVPSDRIPPIDRVP